MYSYSISTGDSPILAKSFKKQLKMPSEMLTLTCVATGSPQPVIKWYLNNVPLHQSSTMRIKDEKPELMKTKSSLYIAQMQVDDGGLYKCVASNKAGAVSHSERVDVQGPPGVRPMKNRTVVSGADIQLDCFTTGYPIKQITWSRGKSSNLEF